MFCGRASYELSDHWGRTPPHDGTGPGTRPSQRTAANPAAIQIQVSYYPLYAGLTSGPVAVNGHR